jgi:hypothetical protein
MTTSPSVSDLLNAANWEYIQTGTPSANLTPFMVNGQQLTTTNAADGFSAAVWEDTATHQLVVGFEGTQFSNVAAGGSAGNFASNQLKADFSLLAGQIPQALVDAYNFITQTVEPDAAQQGYSASSIFLTGHSLGADEAEYVAERTGLGGMGFEGSGISASVPAVGNGSNFVSVVTYGDSFANYSSDIHAEQPFAPAYVANGGALPHYGEVVMIGNPADEAVLSSGAAQAASSGPLATLADYGSDLLLYHLPETQAYYLGVTLNQTDAQEKDIGVQSGPGVWNVANDSIGQFLSAAEATKVSGNQALTGSATDASLSDPQTNKARNASVNSGIFASDFGASQPLLDGALNVFEQSIASAMMVAS